MVGHDEAIHELMALNLLTDKLEDFGMSHGNIPEFARTFVLNSTRGSNTWGALWRHREHYIAILAAGSSIVVVDPRVVDDEESGGFTYSFPNDADSLCSFLCGRYANKFTDEDIKKLAQG